MRKILVVIDMQNDFIDGVLGTAEASIIVPAVKKIIDEFDGDIYFTRDTHGEDYLSTQEGRKLPVSHCIKGTNGWEITSELDVSRAVAVIDKPTFGYIEVSNEIAKNGGDISDITIIGLCTDICVISNAMIIKAAFPEANISVIASACAGVTPESHKNALEAMKMCQIQVIE